MLDTHGAFGMPNTWSGGLGSSRFAGFPRCFQLPSRSRRSLVSYGQGWVYSRALSRGVGGNDVPISHLENKGDH